MAIHHAHIDLSRLTGYHKVGGRRKIERDEKGPREIAGGPRRKRQLRSKSL